VSFRKGQSIFAQGDASDAVFVIQMGMVRLSARSHGGKETTLDILGSEDLMGRIPWPVSRRARCPRTH